MAKKDVDRTIAELSAWLSGQVRLLNETGAMNEAIVAALRRVGLPVVRYTTGVPSLHPQVDSFSAVWEEGKGQSFRRFRLDEVGLQRLAKSPMSLAYDGKTSRYDLTQPPQAGEFEILAELRAAGLTDYLVMALPFGDGSFKALTLATDAPDGFGDDDVAIVEGLRHPVAAVFEARYMRHLTRTLVDTYIGPVAGPKVLDGAIKRGEMETIRAVIWFCDLKGFTALSERVDGAQLLDTLNTYFDVITKAIADEGGEVLKFIGDAVMAIFQPADGGEAEAARRALRAAQAAVADLAGVNATRRDQGKVEIACGIALHTGDVLYGNVGGQSRLDFTVIGPAVNLAARIEGLTRETGRPVLVSADFTNLHGGAFESLGAFAFKGIAADSLVFAPAA